MCASTVDRRPSGIRYWFSLLNIPRRRSYLSKTFLRKGEKEKEKNDNLTEETHLFLLFLSSLLLSNWQKGLVVAFSMLFWAIDTILIDICIIKRSIHIWYSHWMDVINQLNDIFLTFLKRNCPKAAYYSYHRIDIESGFFGGGRVSSLLLLSLSLLLWWWNDIIPFWIGFFFLSWNAENHHRLGLVIIELIYISNGFLVPIKHECE